MVLDGSQVGQSTIVDILSRENLTVKFERWHAILLKKRLFSVEEVEKKRRGKMPGKAEALEALKEMEASIRSSILNFHARQILPK